MVLLELPAALACKFSMLMPHICACVHACTYDTYMCMHVRMMHVTYMHQVDHPRTKKMEQSLDKTDVAQVFMARSYKPPVTQEKVPLLEYNNEPVNEPEDDLPPPKYSPRDT